MAIPYKIERRRIAEGAPNRIALVHPDTGEELSVLLATDDGYRVLLPDRNGHCTVLLPEMFPTMHMAKQAILEAHEPEVS